MKLKIAQVFFFKALFTRREGDPGTRVTLAFAYFFFFHTTRLQGNLSARVTLARGFPYLPCKHSARDNSPTRINFPPSCVTNYRANLNGIIQFLNLNINI